MQRAQIGTAAVSVLRPEFLKVLPAEAEQVGLVGAAILALIRYATALPNEHNGRMLIADQCWWRASHAEIGRALGGVTHDSVRRALTKLIDAAALDSVQANTFVGDRTRAYRVPDQPLRNMRQSDQPLRDSALSQTRNRVTPNANSRLLPSSTELKERENGASAAPLTNPPACGPFGPRCRKHADIEDPGPCGGCGAVKRSYDAALQAYEDEQNARRAAIRAAINACPNCDDFGRLDADQSDCPKHPNNRRGAASA